MGLPYIKLGAQSTRGAGHIARAQRCIDGELHASGCIDVAGEPFKKLLAEWPGTHGIEPGGVLNAGEACGQLHVDLPVPPEPYKKMKCATGVGSRMQLQTSTSACSSPHTKATGFQVCRDCILICHGPLSVRDRLLDRQHRKEPVQSTQCTLPLRHCETTCTADGEEVPPSGFRG